MITPKYKYSRLTRSIIDGVRYYDSPDGSKLPSVTSILDATQSQEKKDALKSWRDNIGVSRANEITNTAASRGTRMHKWLENYVLDDEIKMPGTNPFSQQSHKMANEIISKGLVHATEFWGTEVPVYFSGLYAGSTDLVGCWKGKPAIMDFKQSNKVKKREWIDDYFIQLLFYGTAHNHMFNTDIKTGVILMCTKEFEYLEFVIEGDEWDHYEKIMCDRIAKYYSIT